MTRSPAGTITPCTASSTARDILSRVRSRSRRRGRMASLRPRIEAEALRESISRERAWLEANSKAGKPSSPGNTVETLDELDGDFELQKPAAGGSLGCLVPPWMFEGSPDVISEAQSPFTNLTHVQGSAGVRLPAGASDHRIWQQIRPHAICEGRRTALYQRRFSHVESGDERRRRLSILAGSWARSVSGRRGLRDRRCDSGAERSFDRIDPPASPWDLVQPPARARPGAHVLLGHHRYARRTKVLHGQVVLDRMGWHPRYDPAGWAGSVCRRSALARCR